MHFTSHFSKFARDFSNEATASNCYYTPTVHNVLFTLSAIGNILCTTPINTIVTSLRSPHTFTLPPRTNQVPFTNSQQANLILQQWKPSSRGLPASQVYAALPRKCEKQLRSSSPGASPSVQYQRGTVDGQLARQMLYLRVNISSNDLGGQWLYPGSSSSELSAGKKERVLIKARDGSPSDNSVAVVESCLQGKTRTRREWHQAWLRGREPRFQRPSTDDQKGGGGRLHGEGEKSIRDLKKLSATGNFFVGCNAKRMTWPANASLPVPEPLQKMESQR